MNSNTCIGDLRQLAKHRVPLAFFDYAEADPYSEETLRANRIDLRAMKLRQRVLIDVSERDTAATVLEEKCSMPIALGPVAMTGLEHGNDEILACRAVHTSGILFTLSALSICSIEDVPATTEKPLWFQLYAMKDRGFVRSLIEQAISARRCPEAHNGGIWDAA